MCGECGGQGHIISCQCDYLFGKWSLGRTVAHLSLETNNTFWRVECLYQGGSWRLSVVIQGRRSWRSLVVKVLWRSAGRGRLSVYLGYLLPQPVLHGDVLLNAGLDCVPHVLAGDSNLKKSHVKDVSQRSDGDTSRKSLSSINVISLKVISFFANIVMNSSAPHVVRSSLTSNITEISFMASQVPTFNYGSWKQISIISDN